MNANRNLVSVVPVLFGVSRSPASLSAAVQSVCSASGRKPLLGSSPHRSGTSSLSD